MSYTKLVMRTCIQVDFDSIDSNKYLSDRVIGAFLALLPKPLFFCADPAFLPLMENGLIARVKKWIGNHRTELQSCSKFCVPLFRKSHWAIAVMDKNTSTISLYDSLSGLEYFKSVPLLLQQFSTTMKQELGTEFEWPDLWSIVTKPANAQTQSNSVDCGVFLCVYIGLLACNNGVLPNPVFTTSRELRSTIKTCINLRRLSPLRQLL